MKLLNIFFALILTSFIAKGQCPNGLAVTITGDNVLSCINSSITAGAWATGGVAPYSYSWTLGVFPPNSASPFIDQPGVYCVTVTDAVGCTATSCVTVTENLNIPIITINGPTSLGCNGGPITLTAVSSYGNSIFQWIGPGILDGGQTENPIISLPGTYFLVVTDPTNGCTSSATYLITGGGLDISTQPVTCFGQNDGSATVNISPNSPPVDQILWSNGATGATITNLSTGPYSVTVTYSDGSTCSGNTTVVSPSAITIQGNTTTLASCGETLIALDPIGGTLPYSVLWSNGATGLLPVFTQTGNYSATLTDANGCTLLVGPLAISVIPDGCNLISGKITNDTSQNCISETSEPRFSNWIVRAKKISGEIFYGLSDSTGHYKIPVFAGEYYVEPLPPASIFELCQPDQVYVKFLNAGDTLPADFTVKAPVLCPVLAVQMSSGLLRRCLSNNYYYINYCNIGSADATDATIEIALDPLMTALSASKPYTVLGNGHLLFEIGNVPMGDCGFFSINIQISCDAVLGQTLCSEAKIDAPNACPPGSTSPQLALSHDCAADKLQFVIENTGPTFFIADYVVIEDAVMHSIAETPLNPGQTMNVDLPKNGSTWRMEAQVDGTPVAVWRSVEGCGTNGTGSFSTGYVNLFPQDPLDYSVDVDCGTVVGSFDPNDKAARPAGFDKEHFIKNGTEIEYKIRFQNTGTDTAFNVAIRDTLDANLDPATFRAGASSHAFTTELLSEGVLVFHFKNILLADSFVNEPASNGFVEFSIKTKDRPDGTVIKNDAAIYFDFNDPVITNEVFHTIGTGFVPTATFFLPDEPARLTAAPNPFVEKTTIDFGEKTADAAMVLRVFDMFSKEIRREKVASNRFVFERRDLPSGFYFLLLEKENGQAVGSGKLIVR